MGIFDSLKTLVGNKTEVPQAPVPITPPSKKILVVEDEMDLREFYADLLTGEGYNVIKAENGQVGLDMIMREKPALVLLDLMMPIMDGKTMLHKLREMSEFKTLPVIVLTNSGDSDSIRETTFYDKANGFLIKANVSPDEIVNRVKTFV